MPKKDTLVLPPLTGPQLPPAPPALTLPELPSAFLGCWQGDPGAFDSVATDAGVADIGVPGKIVFCYSQNNISIPEAEIRISAGARTLDWLMHLGLGFSSFKAHGIDTDVYSITDTRIHARTSLMIIQTHHWLYVIPSRTEQPSQVDWFITLTASDTALVQASQVIANSGLNMWGTWHGTFHRIADK